MPTLDWLNRASAFTTAARVPYRLALAARDCTVRFAMTVQALSDFVAELQDGRIAVIEYKGAHLVNDPYEMEKRQVGELWARKSQGRCLFGQIVKDRAGVGMPGQLDALLA